MGSFSLSGGVEVLGFISPTDSLDTYAVIDPLYGVDGFRNVNFISDLNLIPGPRRRAGMVVGVSGGTTYYKLNSSPWNYTFTDWSVFNTGGSMSGDYLPLSGGTVTGNTVFNLGLSANTIYGTTYQNLPIDVRVTGGTYSNGTTTFINNTGGTFSVTGFYTGQTSYVNSLTTGVGLSADTTTGDITIINADPDQTVVLNNGSNISVTGTYPNFTIDVTGLTDFNTFTTGFTYSSNTFTILDNSGNTFDATFTDVTGLTVNGDLNITGTTYSNTLSATTYLNLPTNIDVFVTGGTYSNGSANFTNNTGGTFSVSGFVSGDTFVTGLTFNTLNYNLTIGRNDGVSFTDSLSILASDLTVTGGTYNPSSGVATFTNNTGGTFNVTGFLTGFSDTFVTGFTYSNNTFTIGRNQGQPNLMVTINTVTGLTINGGFTVTGTSNLNGTITSSNLSGSTDRLVQVNSGGTFSATQEIISAYITSGGTAANQLENVSNWDINGNYTGPSITGTYQGQKHYDGNYFYEAVQDNIFIRLIRG